MTNFLRSLALVLVAAASGGLVAYGVAEGGDRPAVTTVVRTVEEPASLASAAPAADDAVSGAALSATEIYRRDAPGVVVITAIAASADADPFDPFGSPGQQG